ncbi:MAG: recombinase family protein [Candidatus Margulisbacteria bacterium]|nr:recombinase family protein [Candidatus Margulisiibacteriota bacterium]
MEEKFKVSLYIRVSTERQANEGDSLEEQESELKKFCDYRNYQIHNIYIERGKSGGNTNRPEYQKLIKDVEQKKIKAVVVKKLDRLSRSLLDFEQFMKLLQEKEIEFISLKESFDTTTAMGKAMLRVALVFAQLEREQTSERIADVMGHRASMGHFNGGRRLYGYSIVEKELVPYPKEKQIVETIFQKFLETRSTVAVMHYLNENGFPYRNGKRWDERQIQKMLQQEAYIGKITWGGHVYNGIHQPIITPTTFEKVQQIFKAKTYTKTKNTTNAILAKKVFCSRCGSPLAPSHTVNRHKKKFFYYRCTGSKDKGKTCPQSYFSLARLEARVTEIILSLSEEKHFRYIENKLLKHNEQIMTQIAEHDKSLRHMESLFSQLKIKKDKYLDTLLSSQFLSKERELINTKINEMETEEKQLKAAITKEQLTDNQIKSKLLPIAEVKKQFIVYRSGYPFENIYAHRLALAKIIEQIRCSKDTLEFQFTMLPDNEIFALNQ